MCYKFSLIYKLPLVMKSDGHQNLFFMKILKNLFQTLTLSKFWCQLGLYHPASYVVMDIEAVFKDLQKSIV